MSWPHKHDLMRNQHRIQDLKQAFKIFRYFTLKKEIQMLISLLKFNSTDASKRLHHTNINKPQKHLDLKRDTRIIQTKARAIKEREILLREEMDSNQSSFISHIQSLRVPDSIKLDFFNLESKNKESDLLFISDGDEKICTIMSKEQYTYKYQEISSTTSIYESVPEF